MYRRDDYSNKIGFTRKKERKVLAFIENEIFFVMNTRLNFFSCRVFLVSVNSFPKPFLHENRVKATGTYLLSGLPSC